MIVSDSKTPFFTTPERTRTSNLRFRRPTLENSKPKSNQIVTTKPETDLASYLGEHISEDIRLLEVIKVWMQLSDEAKTKVHKLIIERAE